MLSTSTARLARVSRRDPCPICEHTDYCGFTEDGAMVICMRVAEGSIKPSKNGGYVHVLREREFRPFPFVRPKPEPPPVAPIERRHIVYQDFLGTLSLHDQHANDLARRGLSDLTIVRNGYASIPERAKRIYEVAESLAIFHDLNQVPGFFLDYENCWRFAARRSGYLIPVRDVQGRIQACQIRQDSGTRYVWFSSPDRKGGASSGAPVHFARPWRAQANSEAIVTEGALKADVIAETLDCCVVGIPGVSSFAINFGSWLTFKLPTLKAVYLAYDSDWRTKPQVGSALARLIECVMEAGLACTVLDWDSAKGLDDLLLKGVA